jgi:hypothetical protein
MIASLKGVKDEIDRIEREENRLAVSRNKLESSYAIAKAESLGVKVGSVVTVKTTRGWGSKAKEIVTRYRVTGISYSYGDPELHGITIRKDGRDGAQRRIWRDWELEK